MRYSRRQHHVAGSKPRVSHLAVWGSYVGFFGEYLSRRLRTAAMSREEYMKLRPLRLMPIWSRHFAIMFTGFKSAPARAADHFDKLRTKKAEEMTTIKETVSIPQIQVKLRMLSCIRCRARGFCSLCHWLRSLPLTLKNQPERSQGPCCTISTLYSIK